MHKAPSHLPLIGVRKNGMPIYLMAGGSGENAPKDDTKDDGVVDEAALRAQIEQEFKDSLSSKNREAQNLRKRLNEALALLNKDDDKDDKGKDKNDKSDSGDDPVAQRLAALEKQLADAEKARKDAEVTALRASIGTKHNLPGWAVELLRGDDEEALEAHAATLAENLKTSRLPRGVNDPAFRKGIENAKGGSLEAGAQIFAERAAAKSK